MINRWLSVACFALAAWPCVSGHERSAGSPTAPAISATEPASVVHRPLRYLDLARFRWFASSAQAARPLGQAQGRESLRPLGPRPTDEPTARDAETVQATVDDVLSAPEYRHLVKPKTPESETKLPKWLERFLDWLFGGGNTNVRVPNLSLAGLLLRGLMYLVAVTILVLVVILIVRSVLQHLPDRSIKKPAAHAYDALAPATPPGELPADEYVRRAMGLARAGDHKAAIRQLLLGTMSWIERAGLIRFRKGLTNRDYLRAIWRRPTCRESMAAIADAFDRVYFGRRTATPEVFERCLEQYQTGFAAPEASRT